MKLKKIILNKSPVINSIFGARSSILAVYLFGSTARGKEGPLSDVDFAILYYPEVKYSKEAFKDELRMADEIETILRKKGIKQNVEILTLNNMNILLRHKVIGEGIRIYCRDKNAAAKYEANVISYYCDFKPTIDFMDRFYIKGKLKRAGVR